jgi:D-tyrosyl-tRNA(Tyr) deacylase
MARAVVQRVTSGSVSVGGREIGRIGRGLVILLGIGRDDSEEDACRIADKIASLRIFEDAHGKMNLAASDVGGSMLAISQFTLYGDVRKGRRPSFVQAATPDVGLRLYDRFCLRLAECGYEVQRGQFGAEMLVTIANDGPVTIVIDSDAL